MDSTIEAKAMEKMKEAFELLKGVTPEEAQALKSRENSLVLTKLEEAMMWCNKDRTIKGEFTPNEDHVQLGTSSKG